MKKKYAVLVSCLALSLLLFGCKKPPQTPNALPPALMSGDVLYYYTGQEVPAEIDEAAIIGTITTTVPLSEMPAENGQSNMSPLLDCTYAEFEDNIVVLIDNEWVLFETRD